MVFPIAIFVDWLKDQLNGTKLAGENQGEINLLIYKNRVNNMGDFLIAFIILI